MKNNILQTQHLAISLLKSGGEKRRSVQGINGNPSVLIVCSPRLLLSVSNCVSCKKLWTTATMCHNNPPPVTGSDEPGDEDGAGACSYWNVSCDQLECGQ